MPYTDASALALSLPANQGQPLLTATSFPNLDQAATYIAVVSAELDGAALAAGYSVPIPSTASSAWLQMVGYAQMGAGARVIRQLLPHLSSGSNDTSNIASNMERMYRLALNDIRSGNILLTDAPRDMGIERPLARSDWTDHPEQRRCPDIRDWWRP